MDINDTNKDITLIGDQTITENKSTKATTKEEDIITTTPTTIDTNNNTDNREIIQVKKEIIQVTETDNQKEKIAGIPAMDIDTNSIISTEKGGGGDDSIINEGDVELYDEEERLIVNDRETNIELQNYIQQNNKNKEKVNNIKTKINNIIKIGVLNIRGLNDDNNKKNKKENLKNYILKEQWDITGVNETKLNRNKGKHIYRDWNEIKIRNNSADDLHSLGSQLLIYK
jgi:hypothetical protein